jgi:hypothetical protein
VTRDDDMVKSAYQEVVEQLVTVFEDHLNGPRAHERHLRSLPYASGIGAGEERLRSTAAAMMFLGLGRLRAFVELSGRPRSVWKLSVECLSIPDTAAQKLWPVGDREVFRNRLRQKAPELRMMPAQFMTRAVAVGANPRAQPDHLGDQFLSRQGRKIVVHRHHRR